MPASADVREEPQKRAKANREKAGHETPLTELKARKHGDN
jgi:hypothetical protein